MQACFTCPFLQTISDFLGLTVVVNGATTVVVGTNSQNEKIIKIDILNSNVMSLIKICIFKIKLTFFHSDYSPLASIIKSLKSIFFPFEIDLDINSAVFKL